jgi:preprotein translocase SecF subunit
MVDYLKYRKLYYLISGLLILGSVLAFVLFGFNLGIDFTGGSILELYFPKERPSVDEIANILKEQKVDHFRIQPTNEKGYTIRMPYIEQSQYQSLTKKLAQKWNVEERGFENIGPIIGKELKEKTKIVILVSLIAIVLYIAFSFRQVSFPVKSWQYGLSSLLALFHDVIITLGVFSVLGKFYDIPLTIPIITALLTIIGYSINNTVVVFDRIRENLQKNPGGEYENIVNLSLNQTLIRSLNTSFTTLLVLFAIFFLGSPVLRYFALALIVGISVGTFSSFFIASPILVSWHLYLTRKKNS